MLKFFPVWAFAIPVLIGVTTQMVMYGVSTIWPFIAVSISCVFMCLQNEVMYRDKLTGLYNRFYLNILEGELKERSSNAFSAVMIDVNRFKEINDTYGHLTGDDALIDVANILRRVVSDLGEVTRYAGDEFIVIVNSQDAAVMDDLLDRINKAMETFNATKGKPYRLSVSMGYEKMDFNKHTMGEVLDATDVRMYENKREFYRTHPGLNRRR
ncbi:MAG: GGDEF domain-containing protein [Clostridia bacterium]|nr:GGDEF domain-containing protein [Clostridia bacterium]